MRDISDQLRVTKADLLGVVAPHQFLKELLQGMRFRDHRVCPSRSTALLSAVNHSILQWLMVTDTSVRLQTQVTSVYLRDPYFISNALDVASPSGVFLGQRCWFCWASMLALGYVGCQLPVK